MSNKPPGIDDENPELTDQDFRRAKPASELPSTVLAAFPNTRPFGSHTVPVPISDDIVRHFKAGGPDWEKRIEALLREAIRAKEMVA